MRTDWIVTVFYILIFGLIINGCVHSCKKHKDDPDWVQHSPLAIYRGVEYFWHDDFKGLDWDKRLSSDVYVMFELMSAIGNTTEVETLANEVEKFSKKIEDYPKDKKEYLKVAFIRFTNYSMSVSEDMISYLTQLKDGEDVNPKKWNKASKPLQDSIVRLYEFTELETVSKEIDSLFRKVTINYRLADVTREDVDKMQNTIGTNTNNQLSISKRFYKLIFSETLPAIERSYL
jgi:hypothetical protein